MRARFFRQVVWAKPRGIFIVAMLLVSCSPIRGCVESEFRLAPESRLPKWFSLPVGSSRGDVTVKLTYYSSPMPVDGAVLEFVGQDGQKLSQVTGQMCWHPVMNKKRNKSGGFDSDSYPHYVYVRAKGGLEVIEHTRGPTFRIVDDPALVKEATESSRCDKG
jgi:hypothetical protein